MFDMLRMHFAFAPVVATLLAGVMGVSQPTSRTVIRNATLVPLEADALTATQPGQTVIVEDGLITKIFPSTQDDGLKAGDVLVDAKNHWVLPGCIEVVDGPPPTYAECARRPLRGVTTLIGRFGPTRRSWFRVIDRTASLHVPDLLDTPTEPTQGVPNSPSEPASARGRGAETLRSRTGDMAKRFGLADRGRIAIGARGDLVIVSSDPFDDPTAVETPTEMLIAGAPMRTAALETHRNMIREADEALDHHAAQAKAQPGNQGGAPATARFAIESSGLRVGRLVVATDAHRGEEFWGRPIDRTSTWTHTVTGPDAWRLTWEEAHHDGTIIDLRLHRAGDQVAAEAEVRNGTDPRVSTVVPARADHPLLDPVSFALLARPRLLPLNEGDALPLDVVEPVQSGGAIKVGIRTVRVVRTTAEKSMVPVDPGERVFRLEYSEGTVWAWLVTDDDARPVRASLLAPAGVTEYLLERELRPQPKRPEDSINQR